MTGTIGLGFLTHDQRGALSWHYRSLRGMS